MFFFLLSNWLASFRFPEYSSLCSRGIFVTPQTIILEKKTPTKKKTNWCIAPTHNGPSVDAGLTVLGEWLSSHLSACLELHSALPLGLWYHLWSPANTAELHTAPIVGPTSQNVELGISAKQQTISAGDGRCGDTSAPLFLPTDVHHSYLQRPCTSKRLFTWLCVYRACTHCSASPGVKWKSCTCKKTPINVLTSVQGGLVGISKSLSCLQVRSHLLAQAFFLYGLLAACHVWVRLCWQTRGYPSEYFSHTKCSYFFQSCNSLLAHSVQRCLLPALCTLARVA